MTLSIVSRVVERMLVVLAGALAIYLGFRLFIDMPNAERGSGKVSLPGGVSIFLSRVGPGVFFSLFGAVVLGLSFHYGTSFSETLPQAPQAVGDVAAAQVERNWSGAAESAGPDRSVEAYERDRVVITVATLNKIEASLSADVKPTERVTMTYALRDARARLLISVWDPAAWGDVEAFETWIRDGASMPPPEAVGAAAGLFLKGRPGAAP